MLAVAVTGCVTKRDILILFFVSSMMIKFVLLVNKQGQTRLSQYYEYVSVEEKVTTEADIVRKCLARNEDQVIKYTGLIC